MIDEKKEKLKSKENVKVEEKQEEKQEGGEEKEEGSGSGKSLFMQNLAVNWILDGLNVLYFTLELSEELTAMRIDSMISNVPTREIFKDLDNVEMKIKLVSKKAGCLQIKYMPAQSNINDFRKSST